MDAQKLLQIANTKLLKVTNRPNIVIEKGKSGKEKVCGDAFVSSAVRLLDQFSIDSQYLETLGGYYCNRIEMYVNDILIHEVEYRKNGIVVLPRKIIDQEIRNIVAKNVSFRYETLVKDIQQKRSKRMSLIISNRRNNNERISCDAIILATGSMNEFSRKFDIDGRPKKSFAISTYAELEHNGKITFQFIESCEPGYRWIFPVSDTTANIGICLLIDKPRVNLRVLGSEFLKEYNIVEAGEWRGGWGPIWSSFGKNWYYPDGIVSCGDAAGLINPYSGEGITAALISGKQAGNAVAAYLKDERNIEKLRQYSEWITNHFSDQYKLTPLLQTWCNLCGINI